MSQYQRVPHMMGFAAPDEVRMSRSIKRPNTIFLSVGGQCNLNCIYCYTVPKHLRPNRKALSFSEQVKLLDDAVSLGVRYLIIPGPGEPLLFDELESLVSSASQRGIYVTIITNGTCIDRELALRYIDMPVSFMVKLNSQKREVQDFLIGQPGMAEKIYRAIDILIETGFTGYPLTRLAIDTLICQQTVNEIPDVVRFALNRQIHPVVERLLAAGLGLTNRNILEVDESAAALVLEKVQRIMGSPEANAFSGCACDLHDYTIFVDVDGMVTKCVGGQRDILIGDCRTESLIDIWTRQLANFQGFPGGQPMGSRDLEASKCPGRSYCEIKSGILTDSF